MDQSFNLDNINISIADTFEKLKDKKDELKAFVHKVFNQVLQSYHKKVIPF